ncbi:MAG: hypothetical protein OIF32_06110 [Campylobacterales bacterium]|nr:hypothetical protein [Campylobacterales bacterium]
MKFLYLFSIFLLFTGCSIDLSDDETKEVQCVTTTYGQVGECATLGGKVMTGQWDVYDGNITATIENNETNLTSYSFTKYKLKYILQLKSDGICWHKDRESNFNTVNKTYQWAVENKDLIIVDYTNTQKPYRFLASDSDSNLIMKDGDSVGYLFEKYN